MTDNTQVIINRLRMRATTGAGGSDRLLTAAADALEAALAAVPMKADERIEAWDAVAGHPFFRECYSTEGPLLDAMLAKLAAVPVEGEVDRVAAAIAKAADADYWVDEIAEWEGSEEWEREAHPENCPIAAYEDRTHFRKQARAALAASRKVEVTDKQRRALAELEVPLPNGHQYLRLGEAGADAVVAALGGHAKGTS